MAHGGTLRSGRDSRGGSCSASSGREQADDLKRGGRCAGGRRALDFEDGFGRTRGWGSDAARVAIDRDGSDAHQGRRQSQGHRSQTVSCRFQPKRSHQQQPIHQSRYIRHHLTGSDPVERIVFGVAGDRPGSEELPGWYGGGWTAMWGRGGFSQE